MGKLWRYGIVVFLVSGLFLNKEEDMMNSLFNTPYLVMDLMITLVLSACLWGGFLKIIQSTGFMNYFSFVLRPVLLFIYGDIMKKDEVYTYISTNVIANLFGLGTLATVSGLRAFKHLQLLNHKDTPSKEMLTLVVMNTAGLCLFPSSIIMLRKDFESASLYAFYPYMLLISVTVLIIAVIILRMMNHE